MLNGSGVGAAGDAKQWNKCTQCELNALRVNRAPICAYSAPEMEGQLQATLGSAVPIPVPKVSTHGVLPSS